MKFSGTVGNGPVNERLNFGGDPDPDGYAGKTCFVEVMHYPSASIVMRSNTFRGCLLTWHDERDGN